MRVACRGPKDFGALDALGTNKTFIEVVQAEVRQTHCDLNMSIYSERDCHVESILLVHRLQHKARNRTDLPQILKIDSYKTRSTS